MRRALRHDSPGLHLIVVARLPLRWSLPAAYFRPPPTCCAARGMTTALLDGLKPVRLLMPTCGPRHSRRKNHDHGRRRFMLQSDRASSGPLVRY